EHLKKDCTSPVYALFDLEPVIQEIDSCRAQEFKCSTHGCKVKIWQYLDTKDAYLTSNMCKHVKACWGNEVLNAVDDAKDANDVQNKIIKSILRNGSITTACEQKGKGAVTTHSMSQLSNGSLRTGCPECYLPPDDTVLHDVKQVYVCTHQCIAKMLKEYNGKLNFTTNAWTPNNHAFVAFTVHLEKGGKLLTFPLDIVEVAKVILHLPHGF
ncbi:hypothetical protein PAXRUDRAFT_146678, partial [Paxillus rubicundulus Ve08.2h10]